MFACHIGLITWHFQTPVLNFCGNMVTKEGFKWLKNNRKRLQYVLVMQSNVKFTLVWMTFVIGSFSYDFVSLPQSYFSNRRNIFNVLFVKKGWGWTFFVLAGYLFCILLKKRVTNLKVFYQHFTRLFVLTIAWFLSTSIFDIVENYTGSCLGQEVLDKLNCKENGFIWSGFDVSGHCFLLTFCILIINEELHSTNAYNLSSDDESQSNYTKEKELKSMKSVYGIDIEEKYIDHALEVLSVMLIVFMLLWEVMLFFTCAYFHTLLQKLCGIIAGVGCAYLCYDVIFKLESVYAPRPPSVIGLNN